MNIGDLLDAQRQQQAENRGEFTPATGWLNVVGITNDGTSVSIGGIAIESLKPVKGSSDWANQKNGLIQAILNKFNNLEEGQACTLKLSVELRKVGEQATESSTVWDI